MKAQLIKFPNRFLPAIRRDEKCAVVKLPIPLTPRECPKITELRRQSKMLREHFKPSFARLEDFSGSDAAAVGFVICETLRRNPKFSGGTCSGGE